MSCARKCYGGISLAATSNLFGDVIKPPWVSSARARRLRKLEASRNAESPSGGPAGIPLRRSSVRRPPIVGTGTGHGVQARLLMLDEPTAGMNPSEVLEFMEKIRRIHAQGFTILLIEHNLNVVMGVSQRITVLDYGTTISEGTPEEVRRDERVIEAYLGRKAAPLAMNPLWMPTKVPARPSEANRCSNFAPSTRTTAVFIF